jgi:MFS family permease
MGAARMFSNQPIRKFPKIRELEKMPSSAENWRLFLSVFGCLVLLGASGCLSDGFNAIKPILVENGIYSHLCSNATTILNTTTCNPQVIRLNAIYTVGVNVNLCLYFVFGVIFDLLYRKMTVLFGSFITICGMLLFGFSNPIYFDMYIPGFILMGVGGNLIYLTILSFLHDTDRWKGLLNGMSSAMYSLSSMIFLVFFALYRFGIPLIWSFLVYGSVLLLIIIPIVIIVQGSPRISKESIRSQLKGLVPWRHIFTIKFLGISFGFSLQVLSNSYYISTVYDQLVLLSMDPRVATRFSEIFSIMFPIGGVASSILLGYACDQMSHTQVYVLHIMLTVLSTLFASLKNLNLQIMTFILFIMKNYFTYISLGNVIYRIYDEGSSSRMFSFAMSLAGIVGFSTSLMNWITLNVLEGNHVIMGAILCGTSCLGTFLSLCIVYSEENQ